MGKQWNSVRLYFLGLQNHCRWWLQPWNEKTLTSWKESYDQLSVLKNRDITWPAKVCLVEAMIFLVVLYRYESWTIKKAERWRIDAFELRCWRRLLRVPWTARRSNQSILKEIGPEYSLEGLMLKLKFPYFGQPWCWERLRAGGEGVDRGREGWMVSLTQWTWVWANSRR